MNSFRVFEASYYLPASQQRKLVYLKRPLAPTPKRRALHHKAKSLLIEPSKICTASNASERSKYESGISALRGCHGVTFGGEQILKPQRIAVTLMSCRAHTASSAGRTSQFRCTSLFRMTGGRSILLIAGTISRLAFMASIAFETV